MLRSKGFFWLILTVLLTVLFLPACFKLGGEPSIDTEFTLTREVSLMGISEFAFSVDVKGLKDAAVVEFDNGMPSVTLSGGKGESRFFANIGTGEVTLSVRDSRGVELLKKTVALPETKSTFDAAAVEDRTGVYVLMGSDLIFYSLECLENMTFAEKVELLIGVLSVNDSYVIIDTFPFGAWIWDFATYPNNPKYDLTQDTLDMLGLPNYAFAICEEGLINILNGKSLYLLVVEVDPEEGGEVEVDPDQILYEEGTEVSLTAIPASAEWLFGSWSGDLISTDPVETIVMDKDKVITANFYEAEDPYIGEPDEIEVCNGQQFEIVVTGHADMVEITFEGVTKAAVEDPEGLFTATFTAPTVAKDVTRAISIKAVKGPKEKSWTWEDKVTVKAEEVMVINDFYVEDFDCGADETEIVVITCCHPEPDLINSFIAIEYTHSGEIEYLTDPEVTPLPGCEVELRYSWEFPRTECTDATVTAFIKSQCSEYVTETVVVEGIAVLESKDVIEIGIDPLTIPCNATEVTFPVKINYSLDKLVNIFVDACRGEIISGSIATLLETGEETFTVDFSNLDCRQACFAVTVVAEDCEGCPQEFEICYFFDLDNVKPEAEIWLDPECNATSTTVSWEVYDRALSEISIEVSDGNLVWWEDSVKKTGKVYHEYTAGASSTGAIAWEFDPWCGDLEITLTATDFCGERDLECESDCCEGLNKNTTVVSKKIFIDNIAPEIEFIGIPDQICEGNTLTFDWILEDCQLATVTGIRATMFDVTTDATFAILAPWKDGISSGIATVTWEGTVTCGELTIELFGVDECGNIATENEFVLVNTAEPEVVLNVPSREYYDGTIRICRNEEIQVWYEAGACIEEMKMTLSRGCFDSKETCYGQVISCDEWIWKRGIDFEYSHVVIKLPKMDCEELVITLTGVDVCGREVENSQTFIVDNIAPDIQLNITEIDKCSTQTVIDWVVTDRCLMNLQFDEWFWEETDYATEFAFLYVTPNTIVELDPESESINKFFQSLPTVNISDKLNNAPSIITGQDQREINGDWSEWSEWTRYAVSPTGYATWTYNGLDCEEINLYLWAQDTCWHWSYTFGYLTPDEIEYWEHWIERCTDKYGVLFGNPIIVDNVGPRILEFGFVDEAGQPVDRSDMSCEDVYTTDLLYLTWNATDNCPEDAVLTVDLGTIEEYVYDSVQKEWIWVDRGQETFVPWSSDGSKWRWNVKGQDCYYGTIKLEVFDSCGSDSTTTTILVDNVAPDFWFDASIEECSDEICVTITWTGYDRCMTCGTDDCGSWDIGKIFFSHPDVKTGKTFANINIIDTCLSDGPEYSGTITWCFGNLDCETLVATIVGWDSAGNMSEPWGIEIGNTDTVPPTITRFVTSDLMFEGEIPYVELTWEATDNCFDFVNVWVNQGSFQKPSSEVIETSSANFTPPEPWTAFQKSKSWTKTVKWYLDDPTETVKAWIAAYDICCNEATATSVLGFEFDVDVDWDGGGSAGDGGDSILYGTVITLVADASPCWYFIEWQIEDRNGYSTSTENPLDYTVISDAWIKAIFVAHVVDLVAVDDFGATDQDTVLTVDATNGVLENDYDPDGDDLIVTETTNGTDTVAAGNQIAGNNGGTFIINPDGSYSFDPGEDFVYLPKDATETTSVTYTARDVLCESGEATLTITVTGLNDSPESVEIEDQINEDADDVSLDVSGSFSDPDTGDVLTFDATGLPAGLTIDASTGVISGTIDNSASQGGPNSDGVYTVTVTVTDPHGATSSQTFTWTVTNPPPVAVDDFGATDQDTVLTVDATNGVLENDYDPDGDDLVVTETTNGTDTVAAGTPIAGTNGGTFTINPDGSYTFDPGEDFIYLPKDATTTTSITYTISDGEGGTDTAVLTITVTGKNDSPESVEIENQENEDADDVSLDVSGSFSDPDTGDVLTFDATGLPAGLTIDASTGVISGTIDNSASQGGPNGDGVYSVTVTVTDPHGATSSQTFTWTVTNPVPVAVDDFGATDQDTVLTVDATNGVLENDYDPDGDDLVVTETTNGTDTADAGNPIAGTNGGTFTINPDGSYSFDPGKDFVYLPKDATTTTSITYTISDGEGGTDTAVLTITVTGTNDTPESVEIEDQENEDADEVSLDVSGSFSDPDAGDVLTFDATGLPAGLTIDASTGVISGTIDNSASQGGPNGDGVYKVTVTVTDPHGETSSQTFTWTVTNPPPVAIDDFGETDQDTVLTVDATNGVLENDYDPDGDDLVVTETTNGTDTVAAGTPIAGTNGGTFTINPDGSYTFNPGKDFVYLPKDATTTTSITYTISDGEGGTDTAVLTITVTGLNDAPVIETEIPDQGSKDASEVSLDISGSFSDPDAGDVLTFDATGLPAGLTIDASTGVISGTIDNSASQGGPNGDGIYSVTVTVTDPHGATSSQTFTWTVTNPSPVAIDDFGETDQDTVLTVDATNGVLENDYDPDGDDLVVTETTNGTDTVAAGTPIAGTNGGTFTINPDGSYTFNPGKDFVYLPKDATTTTSITYTISDGEGGTDTAVLTITVTGLNDAPVIETEIPDQGSKDASEVSLDISGSFSDPDAGDVLTFDATGLPAGLTIDASTGVISGTIDNSASQGGPNSDGIYSVTVTVTDPHGATSSQTFTWTVTNPDPVAVDDFGATDQDTVLTADATNGVLENDYDPDGDDLVVTETTNGTDTVAAGTPIAGTNGGTFTINPDGSYSFDPAGEFDYLPKDATTTTSITYTISDGEGGTDTAVLTITVTGTNDTPESVEIEDQENEDADEVSLDVSGSFSDPDAGDVLTFDATGLPAGLTIDASTGVISGTIDNSASQGGPNSDGVYSVTVTVRDPHGATSSQTFTWTVTNPDPVAVDDFGATDQDTVLTVDATNGVLQNDYDPDGDDLVVTETTNGTDTLAAGTPIAGTNGGTFTINEDGSYSFDPAGEFDYLPKDATTTTSITYTISDGEGGTDTAVLTITVTGLNDAPVSTAIENQENEDADEVSLDVSGSFSDPDTGDVLTFDATGLPAGLTIDASTGVISGTIDNSASQGGPNGDGVYTVTVTVTDPHGATSSQTFTWTVTNPVPVAVDDFGDVTEDTKLTETGNVLDNDSDPDGDDLEVSKVNGDTANVGEDVNGTYGYVNISADGEYTYTLDNDATSVQALADGETLTDTFAYTITDNEGGTASATLTITIYGVNDAPVISVEAGDNDSAFINETDTTLEATGTLTLSDIDTTNTVTTTKVATVSTGGTYTGPLPDDSTLIAMFSVTGELGNTEQTSLNGIDWTFNSGSEYFDFLPAGKTLVLTYTVKATDSYGATDEHTVTITITGTNDAPVANPDTGEVTEDAPDQEGYTDGATETTIIAGNVLTNDTDVDYQDTLKVTGVATGTQTSAVGNVGSDVVGEYGTVNISENGSYTYTLDNDDPRIQALADGETLTDTFTYTITDKEGGTASATLTITITGVNDAPVISILNGDTASATLTETAPATTLSTSGTLSLYDVDTTNTVETSVANQISIGGTFLDLPSSSGELPDDATLIAMMSVTGELGNTEQASPNGIKWTFDSGAVDFEFLPEGRTLILTYTIVATDSFGATDTQTVTITIVGIDSQGSLVNDTADVDEDNTLNGNVLDNDIPDPDYKEPFKVTKFTIEGTTTVFNAGDSAQTGVGTITINEDGSYTFIPLPNYSGPVPVITYTAVVDGTTFEETATLTITVNPIADAPQWPVHSGVSTNEDTMVSLDLKMPVITDNMDQNGTETGDHPERLGFIELRSVDTGAKIYKADGTTLLFTGSNNNMRIVIVDEFGNLDTSVHYTDLSSDSNYAGAIKLTKAEFEALKLLPPDHRHENISMTLRVTSYETDDSGNRLLSVTGATSNRAVNVEVLAVTDPVELLWTNETKEATETIDEDTTLDLTSLLMADFEDLDGSEIRSIVISNPAGNSPIVVNGITVTGGASTTISAPGLSTSTADIPAISIGGTEHFSGDLPGITITLRARDTDSDSPGHTPGIETDTVTLNLYVMPIAGDIDIEDVETKEDTAVKFLGGLKLTDIDGIEEIDAITIKNVPDGWVISKDGTTVHTGDGTTDFSIPQTDVDSGDYKDYAITPPAHSSRDATLTVDVKTIDTQTVNGVVETDTATTTLYVNVTVTPVAERVGEDTDGDGIDDLTMNGDFEYTTKAYEDTWFPLNTDNFDFKGPWSNQDTDEETYALLTPLLNGQPGIGSQFIYIVDSATQTLTYTGEAVEIPVQYLDTVEFKAPENVSGKFEIGVRAKTVDTDPDDTNIKNTAISGNATLTNLIVLPVADEVTLAVTSPARCDEDTDIPLGIRATSSDPSETFNVTISGIPEGAVLTYDGVVLETPGGSVTIEDFDRTKLLKIRPPEHSNVDFTLHVSAVSVDTLVVDSVTYTDINPIPAELDISVVIRGVADPAIITTVNYETDEETVDGSNSRIPLSKIITEAELIDDDGSETLTMILTGLDPKFSIEGASFIGGTGEGRQWLICRGDIEGADCPKIVVPMNFSGTIDFSIRPITTEDDGNSRTGELIPVSVTVTPSPEALMVTSTTINEDTLGRVNFNIIYQNGDTDESISSVWLKAEDVEGKDFTLYLGNSTETTLASASETPGSGVVLEEGWYKLTGAAIDSVYAKGAPNKHGTHSFVVKYGVTDPSSDGTLDPVTTQTDASYSLTVRAVTDPTETTITDINPGNNATVDGTTVTATGTTRVSVDVKVQKNEDANAGDERDYDGSESLSGFIVDGVPDGVTVVGGVYIGDTPGNPSTERWFVNVNEQFNSAITETLVFDLDGSSDQLSNLNQVFTITSVSSDIGSFDVTSSDTWRLITSADFDDTAQATDTPATITTAATKTTAALEDQPVTLGDMVDFQITGNSPFSITLTGLPAGTQVSGMTLTVVEGEEIWTASGTGDNDDLQALLAGITVTPPLNWNDNNHPEGLTFDAKLTTYAPGGQQNSAFVSVVQPVTPVTDPTNIDISGADVNEGSDVNITIALSNAADGSFAQIVDGKLYITMDESSMDEPGTLLFDGTPVATESVTGISGIPDGTYYVLVNVGANDTLNLVYRPAEHASGELNLTARLVSQEENATNTVFSTDSEVFRVNPVNSGYDIVAKGVSGPEDTRIELDLSGTGLVDKDGSEKVYALTLGRVPVGYLVYAGNDAASASLIANAGDDGSGNNTWVWDIPLGDNGELPAYIAILPPQNVSGTVTGLEVTVYSGEKVLDPKPSTATFNLEVVPVADGININPTLSFGDEGDQIEFNINATMLDADGSETVTLEIVGLGQYAAFYASGTALDFTYNATTDTYTISGITPEQINDLTFIQSARNGNITIRAKTVESANEDTSATTEKQMYIFIFQVFATNGDDTLLYDGTREYDGGAGVDTLVLRLGEDIDFSTDPVIRNMEIIDLERSGGDHTLDNLSVQDVRAITDNNNTLRIDGDAGDTVKLLNTVAESWTSDSPVVEGGITYDVYKYQNGDTVTVKIQQGITVETIVP